MTEQDSLDGYALLNEMARAGLRVSFVYGRCGMKGILWSVGVLGPNFQTFQKPYAADTFDHAIRIAHQESRERGWLPKR